jgi:hypothetical protein
MLAQLVGVFSSVLCPIAQSSATLPACCAVCICSYQEEGLHGLFAVRNATELLWGYEVS